MFNRARKRTDQARETTNNARKTADELEAKYVVYRTALLWLLTYVRLRKLKQEHDECKVALKAARE